MCINSVTRVQLNTLDRRGFNGPYPLGKKHFKKELAVKANCQSYLKIYSCTLGTGIVLIDIKSFSRTYLNFNTPQ